MSPVIPHFQRCFADFRNLLELWNSCRSSTAKLTQRENPAGTPGHRALNQLRYPQRKSLKWNLIGKLLWPEFSEFSWQWNIILRCTHTLMVRFQRQLILTPPLLRPRLQPKCRWKLHPPPGRNIIFIYVKIFHIYQLVRQTRVTFLLWRTRPVLEYVPAEYFRGESSLYGPPTMSVYCASRLVRCLLLWMVEHYSKVLVYAVFESLCPTKAVPGWILWSQMFLLVAGFSPIWHHRWCLSWII